MKKAMAFCLAALMAAGMTTSAFAAAKDVNPGSVTFDQDSFINGKASVELEYDAVAEPTYTITIPMGVQLVKGGTTSTFKAEGISNLNGGKIVLSITSTRKSGMPDDCPDFALYRGHNYVPYEVQGFYKDGTSHFVSELNKEVMSFDEDGEYRYRVIPSKIIPETGTYWGNITFQFDIVGAEEPEPDPNPEEEYASVKVNFQLRGTDTIVGSMDYQMPKPGDGRYMLYAKNSQVEIPEGYSYPDDQDPWRTIVVKDGVPNPAEVTFEVVAE